MEDERERFLRENALVDAIADDCAAIRSRIAGEEARMLRRLADAWDLAQEQTARIGSASSRRRDMPLRCIASQISVETHLNDRTVQTRMHDAWRLVNLFPASVAALEGGRITKQHADAILDLGAMLEDAEVRAAFETVVLEWAEAETVGRTRAYARQLAEKLDPRTMKERHEDAADERSITIVDLDNAMSQIILLVPTVYAHAVLDRTTQQAKAIKNVDLAARREAAEAARAAEAPRAETNIDADAGGVPDADAGGVPDADASAGPDLDATDPDADFDDRTIDQIRADLIIDLVLTGSPAIDPTLDEFPGGLGAIRAQVQITMPLTTLTGVTDGGAEIDGKAPIDPDTARRLAGMTHVWDRVMYDPVKAVVLTVDRYKPTPRQRRFLHARDQHCRFPGCRRPARRCQIDHNDEYRDRGKTSIGNLACLCVRHHTMKTETGWTAKQLSGGRIEWTTPGGRRHVDEPPRVTFTPSLEPAPF
ncbi:MAG: DUF222 domain-containing protein [Microbacterium sp.]